MKFGTVTQLAPYSRQTIKMLNFSKTKMVAVAILKKKQKLRYYNGLTDLRENLA